MDLGRLHHRKSSSAGSDRSQKKGGQKANALGRSRGGLTSKIHLAADALGLPVRIHIAPGNENDIDHGPGLVDGLRPGAVIADMAYDADSFRDTISALPAKPVIPPSPSRSLKPHCDFRLYRERNLVERLIGRLKQFRRVNTRYDKVACFFRGFVLIAAISLWLE